MNETPIPVELRPALAQVVNRLVAGDYDGLKRDGIDPFPDSDLGMYIRDYGRPLGSDQPGGATLLPLPEEAWDFADAVCVNDGPPRRWAVTVDLWTVEEGRSDLSMEAEVIETEQGLQVVVSDIHVL